MNRVAVISVSTVGLLALIAFSCVQIRTNPQVCHLVHLASPPGGLLRPVVIEPNVLSSKPGRYEYSFTPEYCEIYEIGFVSDHAPLPQGYDPQLRLQAEIVSADGNRLVQIDRSTPARVSLAGSGFGAGKVSYGSFGVAKSGDPLKVIVEISRLDEAAEGNEAVLDLFVGVSGSP